MRIILTDNSLVLMDDDAKLLQRIRDDILELKIVERAMRK